MDNKYYYNTHSMKCLSFEHQEMLCSLKALFLMRSCNEPFLHDISPREDTFIFKGRNMLLFLKGILLTKF